MILTNIETVPGKEIAEHYGLVCGSTVRAKNVFKDIGAGFKNIVGGEMKSYTALLEEARQQAISRMTEQAQQLGANAIINVRFSTSNIAQGASELYVYGTAVKVQ
ncbi:MAG: YbjQ family protein [Candidatus Omnitrophota bacterium]